MILLGVNLWTNLKELKVVMSLCFLLTTWKHTISHSQLKAIADRFFHHNFKKIQLFSKYPENSDSFLSPLRLLKRWKQEDDPNTGQNYNAAKEKFEVQKARGD